MSQQINLKELERRAWTSIFQDGLFDLFLGWQILWMGILFRIDDSTLSSAALLTINMSVYMLSVLLLYLGKRFISRPRAGRARFSLRRLTKVTWVTLVTFVILGATFGLSLYGWSREESLLGENLSPLLSPLLLGLFLLMLFNLPAFFLEYRRLHFIGFMFALPFPAGALLRQFYDIDPGIYAYIIPAAAVIAVGLVNLGHFLQRHPLPDKTIGGHPNATS